MQGSSSPQRAYLLAVSSTVPHLNRRHPKVRGEQAARSEATSKRPIVLRCSPPSHFIPSRAQSHLAPTPRYGVPLPLCRSLLFLWLPSSLPRSRICTSCSKRRQQQPPGLVFCRAASPFAQSPPLRLLSSVVSTGLVRQTIHRTAPAWIARALSLLAVNWGLCPR